MLGLAKELIYFPSPSGFRSDFGILVIVKSADDCDEGD